MQVRSARQVHPVNQALVLQGHQAIWDLLDALGRPDSQVRYAVLAYHAVRTVHGERRKTAECLSVRPSVCPVDRQQRRRLAGLLLRSGAGSRYRSIAAAAAAAAAA